MNSWKNSLIRRFIIGRQPPLNDGEQIRRILVVSTTAMGDTLWATPAIENLRLHFPKAYISVLTSPTGLQILKNNPHIDRLILLKEPVLPRLFSLVNKLKRENFDAALILHASQRLILPLCSLSRIPRIIGTVGINKDLDDLLTDPIEARFEHEIERRQQILDRINVPPIVRTLSYYIQPSEQHAARQYIGTTGKPLIAIHPGSKEPFRRWPTRCFAATARALQEKFGCEIFLTGSSSEKKLLQKIRESVPQARIVSSPSIRFLGAFLEQMDLVLSNDTGPFHLACALNRPAVGLYVSTDPRICGPHCAPQAIAISRNPTCEPCLKRRCRDSFCFLQIAPQEVIDVCSKILKGEKCGFQKS
jgi:lipopolysaccharide heptosyltransferase II